jgi:hypothetical protein
VSRATFADLPVGACVFDAHGAAAGTVIHHNADGSTLLDLGFRNPTRLNDAAREVVRLGDLLVFANRERRWHRRR